MSSLFDLVLVVRMSQPSLPKAQAPLFPLGSRVGYATNRFSRH